MEESGYLLEVLLFVQILKLDKNESTSTYISV